MKVTEANNVEMECQEVGMKEMVRLLQMIAGSEVDECGMLEDQEDSLLADIRTGAKALTWEDVKREVQQDIDSIELIDWIRGGCLGPIHRVRSNVRPFWKKRSELRIQDGVPMLGDRTIIPKKLRKEVLDTLHAAHQGTSSMVSRAIDTVYWPGFVGDIEKKRASCNTCDKISPSQPNLPPIDPVQPEYPMQHKSYGIVVDRFSNWPIIYTGDSADDVCKVLTCLARDYGIPESVSTDGAQCYVSRKVQTFMNTYGIRHRVSSVANPHSNCRAELGVKTFKRMIRDNVTLLGKADTPEFSRALLQYRNTKDRDTGISPAEFMLGRQLRDFLPTSKQKILGQKWIDLGKQQERALADRGCRLKERWSTHAKELPELKQGDRVLIQNQLGNRPRQWHKTGTVFKVNGFDQYEVMMDGSRIITRRNRKFLRKVDRPESLTFPYFEELAQEPQPTIAEREDQTEEECVRERQNSTTEENETMVDTTETEQATQNVQPAVPRRSTRAGRGSTTRYQDYDVQHLKATATEMPIILIDKKGEDVADSDGAATTIWRPWAQTG